MKKEKEKVLYYPVIIHTRANTWVTRNRNEDDEWDKDDTETSTDVLGVETEKDKREQSWFRDVVVPFEVVPGKDYYLVYVTYSTGDSFSRSDGEVAFIDLFETREKAEKLASIINEHYVLSDNEQRWADKKQKPPKGYSEYELTYHNEEGREIKYHVSWTGYFERMSSVTVQKVQHMSQSDNGRIRYRY